MFSPNRNAKIIFPIWEGGFVHFLYENLYENLHMGCFSDVVKAVPASKSIGTLGLRIIGLLVHGVRIPV